MRSINVLAILSGLGLCVAGIVLLLGHFAPGFAIEILGLGANVTAVSYASIFLRGQWPRFKVNKSGIYLSIVLFLLSGTFFIYPGLTSNLFLYVPIAFLMAGAVGFQLSARKSRK